MSCKRRGVAVFSNGRIVLHHRTSNEGLESLIMALAELMDRKKKGGAHSKMRRWQGLDRKAFRLQTCPLDLGTLGPVPSSKAPRNSSVAGKDAALSPRLLCLIILPCLMPAIRSTSSPIEQCNDGNVPGIRVWKVAQSFHHANSSIE